MPIDLDNILHTIVDNDAVREIFDAFVGGAGLLNVLVLAAKNANTVGDAISPNMTIERPFKVVSSRLYGKIEQCAERGLAYSAGKFSIKYADEEHFKLAFEMYFRDDEGKWHKCANESDDRDLSLLNAEARETIKDLRTIEFNIMESDKTLKLIPILNKENGNGIGTKN